MRLPQAKVGKLKSSILLLGAICLASLLPVSCRSVDDDRIPSLAVNVNIADAALWNTYGVAGFGISRQFIISSTLRIPSGFPFTMQSATGFGGILLIGGMDPFTNATDTPLAYDLACPVECRQDVRVEIEGDLFQAVCPSCGSRYDVTMQGGSPVSGPAAEGKHKLGLRRYQCLPTATGGYIITN